MIIFRKYIVNRIGDRINKTIKLNYKKIILRIKSLVIQKVRINYKKQIIKRENNIRIWIVNKK